MVVGGPVLMLCACFGGWTTVNASSPWTLSRSDESSSQLSFELGASEKELSSATFWLMSERVSVPSRPDMGTEFLRGAGEIGDSG